MNGSNMAGAPGWVNSCGGSTREGSTRAVEAPGRELPGLWQEHPDGNMTGASAPTSGAPSEDSREHPCQCTQSGSSHTCIGSMGGSIRHPVWELPYLHWEHGRELPPPTTGALWELPYHSVPLMAGAPVTGSR
ncbi:hypothetical protein FB451DRAFT_1168737 [Mycena latifolia]|nr:hypothetical protein FB451DRAFT_1168737 [Mycena latifolia]